MGEEVIRGLPTDLASVLRDQSVLVAQDASVFEMITAWAMAPTPTASAEVSVDASVFEMITAWAMAPTPTASAEVSVDASVFEMITALADARELLYNLLLAPYHESSHYQITTACVYLEHPMRPSGKRCICGMKTQPKPVNVTETI